MHTMTTRWQHCSTEKAAPHCLELGVSVPAGRKRTCPLPLLPRDPHCWDDGRECGTIPGVSKTLVPFTSMASPVPLGKFCEATLWTWETFSQARTEAQRGAQGWPQMLQWLILPLLPEPEAVAGRGGGNVPSPALVHGSR